MEFPNLGEQCGVQICELLDFLPISCNYCTITFCQEHILPFHHDCSNVPESDTKFKKSKEYSYYCSLVGCKQWELTDVICQFCLNTYCLKHKHQIDHNCLKYVAPVNPMAEAAAKVEQLTAKLICDKPKPRISKKNEKLAAKIQLMKLKSKAIGGSHLPAEERVYFLILQPTSYLPRNSVAVCVSHHWSVGKVIDVTAELTKVRNRNNESTTEVLRLFKESDNALLAPVDACIKDLLEREVIFNGESLVLEYITKNVTQLPKVAAVD